MGADKAVINDIIIKMTFIVLDIQPSPSLENRE